MKNKTRKDSVTDFLELVQIDQMGRMLGVVRLAHESDEDYLIRLKKEGIGLEEEAPAPKAEIEYEEEFRRQWDQQVTSVNNAWKTPIFGEDKD